MGSKILKYQLNPFNSIRDGNFVVGEFSIKCLDSVLTVQKQGSHYCLWVRVNELLSSCTTVRIYCAGTGHGEVPYQSRYLATVQDNVWHLFYTVS